MNISTALIHVQIITAMYTVWPNVLFTFYPLTDTDPTEPTLTILAQWLAYLH